MEWNLERPSCLPLAGSSGLNSDREQRLMESDREFSLNSGETRGWMLFQFGGTETKRLVRSGMLQTEEIYTPMRVSYSRSRHRRAAAKTLALAFPGYLFIRCGASSSSLADKGIGCHPVMFSGRVAIVEDKEISRIRDLEKRWLDQETSGAEHCLSAGDHVSITSGVFVGLSAVVKQFTKGNTRAIISISGSPIGFEISCCLLDKDQA